LLRNEEDLKPEDAEKRIELREKFPDLGMADIMKERLRNIYKLAENHLDAGLMLDDWLWDAEASGIQELKSVAKTFRRNKEGILAYWTTDGMTSGSTEGFNNKIRWLIKQAYGYHDQEYFRLKIFDLPKLKITKDL
jgi:transposase